MKMMLKSFAFFDASSAPAISPEVTLPLTWAAKMMLMIPSGKQQSAEMIAGIK
jgi:hypothetical protein